MDMDLTQALRDAAESGTAHRRSLATGPVLQRIHRRRTARLAVESTVGVAAAGAVAVGAVQVTAMRSADPAPVAPATSSPDPTPTQTTAWSVVTAGGAFECGQPAPEVSDPQGETDLRLEALLSGAGDGDPGPGDLVLAVGEPLTVRPVLVNGTDRSVDAQGAGPQVWLVQDGTVVGTIAADASIDPVEQYVVAPGAELAGAVLGGSPIPCASGEVFTELAAGTYTVHLVQTLELAPGVAPRVASLPQTVTIVEPGGEEPPAHEPPAEEPPAHEPGPGDGVGRHPDLDELFLTSAGLGPLAVGVPPATNPGAAMIEWDPEYCEPEMFSGELGRWVPSGYPDETVDGATKQAFYVEADDTAVRRIDVLGPTIRTPENVGVGTSLTELRATYPALEGPVDGPVSRVWWLTGPTGTLVLETQGDEDGLQPAGTPEKVVLMRVLEAGIDPRFAAANSGDVAGTCM